MWEGNLLPAEHSICRNKWTEYHLFYCWVCVVGEKIKKIGKWIGANIAHAKTHTRAHTHKVWAKIADRTWMWRFSIECIFSERTHWLNFRPICREMWTHWLNLRQICWEMWTHWLNFRQICGEMCSQFQQYSFFSHQCHINYLTSFFCWIREERWERGQWMEYPFDCFWQTL